MQKIIQFLIDTVIDPRTIITLFGLILAFITFRRHKRKRLTYEVISNTPLLSVNSEVKDRIKIYFDDGEVKNVNLVVIKLTNTGNETINAKDFESAIIISFGTANLLSIEVFERVPHEMPTPHTVLLPNSVSLSPFLMNEDDSITIKLLISGKVDTPTITARIAGVKKIEKGSLTRRREGKPARDFSVVASVLLFLYGLSVVFDIKGPNTQWKLQIVAVFLFSVLFGFFMYKIIHQGKR